MLNVLHIITGLNDGGAEGFLYRLCTYDRKNSHIVVSMMNEGKYAPLLREAGIVVHCLEMPRGRLTLRGLLELRRLLKIHRPDVVQTWMYHADLIGGVVARIFGKASICWGIRSSVLIRGGLPFSTVLIARLCAVISRFVPHTIVCNSLRAAEVHQAMGYRADKFLCIPNGYDISRFKPDKGRRKKIRAELGISGETFLLGMVARYDPFKDHETLFKALGLLKRGGRSFRCVFVGSGMHDTNERIQEYIEQEEVGDNVLFLGQRNDIPDLMNALDVHILSSFSEAFPNVLAEAMACGVPCISTDVGDAALIVGESGWIVPPKDSYALAKAIESAMEEHVNSERWNKRAVAARERIVTNFEICAVVQMYGRCWEKAAGKVEKGKTPLSLLAR